MKLPFDHSYFILLQMILEEAMVTEERGAGAAVVVVAVAEAAEVAAEALGITTPMETGVGAAMEVRLDIPAVTLVYTQLFCVFLYNYLWI